MSRPAMEDYVDVAERIQTFITKYPEGSLQTIDWEVASVGDRTFIVYRAAAFRTPGDKRPGHGIAWEPFPGPTNFTRDSELMNAETAAWGRAIVALGLAANRKIASKQEVKARQPEPQPRGQVTTHPPNQQAAVGGHVVQIKSAAQGLTRKQIVGCLASQGLEPEHLETEPPFRMVPVEKSGALIAALKDIPR